MQTTTLKRNRMAFVSLFVLLLVMSGLSACGSMDLTPLHTDPVAPPPVAQPAPTVGCDEGCHALHRLPATSACDEGARALARQGIKATCRND